jgi:hypothetical protein
VGTRSTSSSKSSKTVRVPVRTPSGTKHVPVKVTTVTKKTTYKP